MQLTSFLVLLAASVATSSRSHSATSLLRGSESTNRIRGAAKHNNNNNNNQKNGEERLLQDNKDPNKRLGTTTNAGLRNPNNKANFDSEGEHQRQGPNTGKLRPREDKIVKASKQEPPTQAPIAPIRSIEIVPPVPDEVAIAVTESPTMGPTLSPTSRGTTHKPTPLPTWTFEVSSPKTVEEAEEVCEYCQQWGCFESSATVTFTQGSSATCAKIREIAPSLNRVQCDLERKSIEEACCCSPETVSTPTEGRVDGNDSNTAVATSATTVADADSSACTFCVGQEFLSDAIINFSSGNDMVSCGGLMDLVQSGLSPNFCKIERTNIEDACCQQEAASSPVEGRLEDESETEAESEDESIRPDSMDSPAAVAVTGSSACTFCVGQQFVSDNIIEFSSGNDMVSCGGLSDLVQSGLSPKFCRAERLSIEQTCCKPIDVSLTAIPTPTPEGSEALPITDAIIPETEIIEEAATEVTEPVTEAVLETVSEQETQWIIQNEDGSFLVIVAQEEVTPDRPGIIKDGSETDPEVSVVDVNVDMEEPEIVVEVVAEEESEDMAKNSRPATIKDGGQRQQGQMSSVKHTRQSSVETTTGRTGDEGDSNDSSTSSVQSRMVNPMYDANNSRNQDRSSVTTTDRAEIDDNSSDSKNTGIIKSPLTRG